MRVRNRCTPWQKLPLTNTWFVLWVSVLMKDCCKCCYHINHIFDALYNSLSSAFKLQTFDKKIIGHDIKHR